MNVSERMSVNLYTVTMEDSINKAIDIMNEHDLHRLPVVSDGKLVGLLTKGMISTKGASKATSLSIFELNYLLSKTSVSTIMEKNVVTINKDELMEAAAVLMLQHDIGCLPVVDNDEKLVGILTQNDLFKSFIDLLGYNDPGSRVSIEVKDGLGVLERITKVFTDNDCSIQHVGVYDMQEGFKNIIFRTDTEDTKKLEKALVTSGYKVLDVRQNKV